MTLALIVEIGLSSIIRLVSHLCGAARTLAGCEQRDLAQASGVSKTTIGAFETKGENARLASMNNRALVEAFERAGLRFVEDNSGGPGVPFQRPSIGALTSLKPRKHEGWSRQP